MSKYLISQNLKSIINIFFTLQELIGNDVSLYIFTPISVVVVSSWINKLDDLVRCWYLWNSWNERFHSNKWMSTSSTRKFDPWPEANFRTWICNACYLNFDVVKGWRKIFTDCGRSDIRDCNIRIRSCMVGYPTI